jgi:hypothetical protein
MEAAVLIVVFVSFAWIKAFRYMMLALLMGLGAYQASLFGNVQVQPHLVIAFALAALVGTILFDMMASKPAEKE